MNPIERNIMTKFTATVQFIQKMAVAYVAVQLGRTLFTR